jgi:hypothetical protein
MTDHTFDVAQRAVEWREAAAEIIYDRMRMACKGETPAWVPQGNAIFQDAARVAADKIAALAAQPPAAPVETRTALDVLGDPAGHVDAPRSDGQTIGEFYGDPRPQCSAAIGDAVQPWYEIELTKHWGEGVSSDETRRAAKTALDEIKLLRAVPQPVPQPTWTEEELALAFFEYSACDERRCGWEEPGICDCRNDARRAVHMVKHVLPLSFPFAAPSLSRPHHSSEGK